MKIDKNDYLRATLPAGNGGGGGVRLSPARTKQEH